MILPTLSFDSKGVQPLACLLLKSRLFQPDCRASDSYRYFAKISQNLTQVARASPARRQPDRRADVFARAHFKHVRTFETLEADQTCYSPIRPYQIPRSANPEKLG